MILFRGLYPHPRGEPIEHIDELLGCHVAVWPPGSYTVRAVAGEHGERLRNELAENARRARDEILAAIGGDG
jgi:hypothetical protein